jgi:diguanylate cyclase (GGDEF)-like protein
MTSAVTLLPELKPIPGAKPCPSVLMVGDQPTFAQTLVAVFQRDHDVFVASNIVQTFEKCRSCLPQLILLDAVMPDMDGFEACRRLKADPETKDIPVILLIARDNLESEVNALEAGAVDFITKPVTPSVVRARVNTHLVLKAQSDLLHSLACVDGLTGVVNRQRFEERLEAEWRRCRRLITPLALLMIDIDNFKKYNDIYGYLAGDACLQAVAAILKKQIGRSHDLLARYDGEEFACILPDADFDGAVQKAEAMVWAIRDKAIPHAASGTASVVTISVGVAVTMPGPDRHPNELVSTAETLLHEAKQEGRNQVRGLALAGYASNSQKRQIADIRVTRGLPQPI